MEQTDTPKCIHKRYTPDTIIEKDYEDITTYYNVAGPDYEAWSKNFNMHFGYCKSLTDIFFLERMLVNMNGEVLKQLQIDPVLNTTIADLGCGVGTVARQAARQFPLAKITGITIADYQIQKGRLLIEKENLTAQVSIIKDNFENLHISDESFTHVYALESACHASGAGKKFFVSEMARVLKTGGRFCIADGFLKHNRKLPRFFFFLYKNIFNYWAIPCFVNIIEFE